MKRAAVLLCAVLSILAIACGGGEEQTSAEAAAGGDVASPGAAGGDAAGRCLELAAKRDWANALDPCSRAAGERPDDLRIQNALQQAQAAARQ